MATQTTEFFTKNLYLGLAVILMLIGTFTAYRSVSAVIQYFKAKHDPEQAQRWQNIAAHAQRDSGLQEKEARAVAASYYKSHRVNAIRWMIAAVLCFSIPLILVKF